MAFPWVAVILFIATNVIQMLLQPKPKVQNQQPAAAGSWKVITAEEGRVIPVPRGRVLLPGANLVWWGNYRTSAIVVELQHHSWYQRTINQTIGYRYYLGAHLVLCHGPIDAVHGVWINGKPLPGASIVVTAENNGLVYSLYPWTSDWDAVGYITPGIYNTIADLCAAIEDVWRPSFAIKVCYGYTVLADWCDALQYSVTDADGPRTCSLQIPPGKHDGAALSRAITAAFQEAERVRDEDNRVDVRVIWVPDDTQEWAGVGHFQFTIRTRPGSTVSHFAFYHGNQGLAENCSYMMGMNVSNAWAGGDPSVAALYYTTEYPTAADRFNLGVPAVGLYLKLAAPACTAAALLGLDPALVRERSDNPGHFLWAGVCEMFHTLSDYPITFARDAVAVFDRGDYFEIVVQSYDLFGGDQGNGGVAGVIDLYKGSMTQARSEYLRLSEADPISARHGICYAVLKDFYMGNSPYIPQIAFEVSARPNVLSLVDGRGSINEDSNPANFLYEILTDTTWGLGVSASLIDAASFVSAAAVFAVEERGQSMVLDNASAASVVLEELQRYTGSLIYIDPLTGLLTLRLVRDDYDPDDLPVLDESNLADCEITRPLWSETRNYIRVRYTDRANYYSERIAHEQDLVNILARGGELATDDVPYLGISSAAEAQRAAARALKAACYPFAALTLTPNRSSWSLRPGDRFKLNWGNTQGLIGVICGGSGGTLEDGQIKITAVQDVFSVDWTSIQAPGEGGWTDPNLPPVVSLASRLVELWYALLGTTDRGVAALCVRGLAPMSGYEVWSGASGGQGLALTNTVYGATPYGVLADALSATESYEIVLDNAVDCDRLVSRGPGGHLLLVGDELISWLSPTVNPDDSVTLAGIARGVCDTAPRVHAAGAPVFLLTDGWGLTDPEPYVVDLTLAARLAPFNGAGKISPAAEPELSITTTSRATRPYCPTALTVNAELYPATVANPVVLAWEHRDRLGSWSYADSGLTAAIETGCQYRVRAYNAGGTMIEEQTTTGKTVTLAQTTAVVAVRVYCEVISGGLLSHDYLLWEGAVT